MVEILNDEVTLNKSHHDSQVSGDTVHLLSSLLAGFRHLGQSRDDVHRKQFDDDGSRDVRSDT